MTIHYYILQFKNLTRSWSAVILSKFNARYKILQYYYTKWNKYCAKWNRNFVYSKRVILHKFLTLILLFITFDFLVDGNFSEWSNWTICSVTCSKGVKRRTRTCTNPSPFNGANCTGNYTEQKVCDQGQCPGTIMFLWFWVYTDHLKIYFTFFKCYNVRVCWQEVNGAYHRQETMFEEEIVKSCQPALYKLHPLKRIRII